MSAFSYFRGPKTMLTRSWPRRLALTAALASLALAGSFAVGAATRHSDLTSLPDHFEFDATLDARFAPDARGAHPIRLGFAYPAGGGSTVATWQVDVVAPRGEVVKRWIGQAPLHDGQGAYALAWDGTDARGVRVPAGFYGVRLRAVPAVVVESERGLSLLQRARRSFALGREELVDQRMDVRVGVVPAPAMPTFGGLPHGGKRTRAGGGIGAASTPASTLPYTIYYGNLHSQTNHSDGGTPVGSCGGAETPQAGTMGPADAYAMMQTQAGGDFLLTSEHNHMYDGSTGTNTAATPAQANNLFASGLTAAATYRSAHPDFLALYGNEWGVISNGGHLNIYNPDGLASWEYNASNQLIGSVATIKSDYANLYSVMKARGWIGQFNHPASSGQFAIGGTSLAYDANGYEVMVAAEVLNSSAFSTNTTQTETSRSTYTTAWNILLERGYHVAPVSDQDNHCANWGLSFRNRTGVLLPTGAAYTVANFLDALKARRAFATEDKTAQVVLTANGQVMGQTIANTGPLTLAANYASTGGGTAARVQFFEGVPGRNGTVTQLFEGAGTTTFTPAEGAHFYYAQVTEADGDRLWSAPVWVNQGAGGGDTSPPTVSASEAGTSGTITLSASASDNVGVTNVEFYVDGVLKGADAASPYAITLDSTTLTNASHALTAKAFDAAGNTATSAAANFTISNPVSDTSAPTVSASESGTAGTITLSATASDNVGVTKVDFLVDGVLKGTDTTSPYSLPLDSTTLTNASHSLTAKAYDAANNVGTSAAVAFTVNNPGSDTTPPSVTASETGSSGTITLSAAATDNVAVTKVEFLVDGVLKGTDTTSPFSLPLDSTTLTNASHSLTAKAYDAMNNVGTSAAVAFTVNNPVSTQFNETESNGTAATANVVGHAYQTIVGTMGNTTDKDFFALALAANETVKVVMSGGPSTSDYDLYLVNASDTALASSTGGTNAETVTFKNGATAQTVYAKVVAYSGSSTTVPYSLALTYTAGTSTPTELVANGGFESSANWTTTSGVIDNSTTYPAHAGSWKAWLNGYGSAHTDSVLQTVTIPATAPSATLTFWLRVASDETTTTSAYDTLKVQVRNTGGTVLATLATYSNLDKGSSYVQRSFDLSAYKGQTVQLYFLGTEGSTVATSFLLDDVSLK
jgi:hypothetical protein